MAILRAVLAVVVDGAVDVRLCGGEAVRFEDDDDDDGGGGGRKVVGMVGLAEGLVLVSPNFSSLLVL